MSTFRHRLNLDHLIIPLSLCILILGFSSPVAAIRMDVNSHQEKGTCRTTVPGRFLLTDDNGHVCEALSVDPLSRCCRGKRDQFSCHGCNLVSQCCNSYEYCVSCCLNPALTDKELALKVKIAKPVTAGLYGSVFDFCAGRCRHNSESVVVYEAEVCAECKRRLASVVCHRQRVHENAYLSEYHHCFTIPSNTSGTSGTQVEARLVGINIIIGSEGESCDSVCKSKGQSCVPNKLALLNQCEIIEKYMNCKSSCFSSIGADQPAEVVDDAPKHLNPGACLYTKTPSGLSCNGSHKHTKRLCPCA